VTSVTRPPFEILVCPNHVRTEARQFVAEAVWLGAGDELATLRVTRGVVHTFTASASNVVTAPPRPVSHCLQAAESRVRVRLDRDGALAVQSSVGIRAWSW